MPTPQGETRYQLALEMLTADDAGRDEILSKFTRLTSELLNIPGSFVSIMNEHQQYIKAARNFSLQQSSLEDALCRHTLASGEVMVCPDTHLDERFKAHPLIKDSPYIRFYAGAPLKMRDGAIVGTLCVTDVLPHIFTEEQVKLLELLAEIMTAWLDAWYHTSLRDAVTLLPNRQSLLRDLEQLEDGGIIQPYSLVLIDCIDMARAYDIARALGMYALEALLQNIAALLRTRLQLRDDDRLYTVSKGRFALLSAGKTSGWPKQLSEKLGQVRARIGEEIAIDLTLHLGEVSFAPALCPPVEALRRGVSALHEAIGQGLPYAAFDLESDNRRKLDFLLLHDLAEALRSEGGLYLVYQPQISLHSGLPVGMEALLRWQHPRLGNLPPLQFLPLAEQTNLMAGVTDWVIVSVLAQLKLWRAKGINLPVSVNVSVSDLAREGFADWLERMLLRAGLSSDLLSIECLETEKLLESPDAMRGLNQLKLRGFTLALDDFGSGYSNINYLKRIPMDVIKLDRSLIAPLAADGGSQIVARHVITMLKELNYIVLAEGVEDEETLLMLRGFGCDEIQGYFCSKPLPAEGVEQWLKSGKTP
ncbi:sensor domain-containing diguanylate cyclase [Erwinia sp. PsM31]|uniref:sensor domain-containing diguanylate cyclase n=1 Tax=Erwinia sp. PsM31 TaxID=3030535 RepID=UPI00263B63D9|nr:sensor domain-containing phosphodiesterase [Erwinia sp. PsM31]MDN4625919.1 sensor domain-containing phosphodiesterase [Erwinia sp. PsM31]